MVLTSASSLEFHFQGVNPYKTKWPATHKTQGGLEFSILEAVSLYTNVFVKQAETTELSYFVADLLCQTDAEEILNLY
jgi:hypothetical protein